MTHNKFRAVVPLILLGVMFVCSCGSTTPAGISIGGGTPTPPPTFDTLQTVLCLGNAAVTFGNLGERSDGNIFVRILEDAFESVFDQSCLSTITTGLTRIQAQVNSGEYVDVGPETQVTTTVTDSPPVDVANCTSSPTKYTWHLGPPLWISVSDTDTNQDVVFQSVDFPQNTYPGVVASYLHTTYSLQFNPFFHTTTYNSSTELEPDQYAEYVVTPYTITYETGIYKVYSGQTVIKGPAQWSFITDMTFPTNVSGTTNNGAHAKGLCTSA